VHVSARQLIIPDRQTRILYVNSSCQPKTAIVDNAKFLLDNIQQVIIGFFVSSNTDAHD